MQSFVRCTLIVALVGFPGCKSKPGRAEIIERSATAFVEPTWHQSLMDSHTMRIAYGFRYELGRNGGRTFFPGTKPETPFTPMGDFKALSSEHVEELRARLSGTFTTMDLNCIAHTDGAVFLEDGTEIDLCFRCGTVVADGQKWNRVDGYAMEKFFKKLLGARPEEPPDPFESTY